MEEEIDVRDLISIILRRWKWIIGFTLVATITAAVGSFLIPPTYEATVTILYPQLVPMDYSSLVRNTKIEGQVIDTLGETLSPSESIPGSLIENVRISSDKDRGLIKVIVQSGSPQNAAKIANAWAELGVQRIAMEGAQVSERLLDVAEQNWREAEDEMAKEVALAIYKKIAYEIEEEKIKAQAQAKEAQVVSPAVPPRGPIEPRKTQNVLVAGALGLLVGIFGALALEYFEAGKPH